jgi:hypothetical protein
MIVKDVLMAAFVAAVRKNIMTGLIVAATKIITSG